jgi:hypothetical protein
MNAILIGLGNVGLNYDFNISENILTHSKALSKNNKINFLFAIDKSLKQRKKFIKKYNTPTLRKLNEIKNDSNIKLALVSTNTNSHLKIIKELIVFKKLKIILVEKPCGKNLDELQKIYNLCKKNKIQLFINYNRLYDQNYPFLKNYIKKLKKFKGVAHYSRGLKNNCSHILSILSGLNLSKASIRIIKNGINPDFIIKFLNGEVFFINTPRKNISHNEIEIFDKNYKIKSKNELNNFDIFKVKKDNLIKNNFKYKLCDKIIFNENYSQKNVLQKIIDPKNTKLKAYIDKAALKISLILDKVIKNNNSKK